MPGDLLEPKADPRLEPEPWVDSELEAEEQRIREEQAQGERDMARFEIECQIDALKEEQERYKSWSRTDSYASGLLGLGAVAWAFAPHPAAKAIAVVFAVGANEFNATSTWNADAAADIGDDIAKLEKKLEKM